MITNLIRPEIRTFVWRWREVIVGLAVLALGLWWALGSFGVLRWVGWAMVLGGLALGFTGVQRLRFASGGGGAGVVEINERRIAYLGPLTGGVIDLDDLTALEVDHSGRPAQWQLSALPFTTLTIPVDAEGADQLFDVFAALPGLSTERMIAALNAVGEDSVDVWRIAPAPQRRLH